MWLFIVYLACVGWCTDVPASRVKSLHQNSTSVDQHVLTDVLAYLVVRCGLQKPIRTKSGQPMLGLGVRLTLGLDYLSHECVACLVPARPRPHIGLPTASASAALVKLTRGEVLYT